MGRMRKGFEECVGRVCPVSVASAAVGPGLQTSSVHSQQNHSEHTKFEKVCLGEGGITCPCFGQGQELTAANRKLDTLYLLVLLSVSNTPKALLFWMLT